MAINEESILDSIKHTRGVSPQDDSFDEDFLMHINSAFSTLHQLGVGPLNAFYIEDNTPKWVDFIGDVPNIAMVKSYVSRFVKLEWDPPSTSFALEASQKKLEEFGWRLNAAMDHSVPSATPILSVTSDPPPTFTTYFTGDTDG